VLSLLEHFVVIALKFGFRDGVNCGKLGQYLQEASVVISRLEEPKSYRHDLDRNALFQGLNGRSMNTIEE
jgi:hypothetical protein